MRELRTFKQVFDRPVNWEDIGRAIGAFERTRLSTEAPIDRFL
jgi:cytochrome c peroxidase